MRKTTEKPLELFNKLNKETQDNFLLALEFSIQSQETTIRQIKMQHPDLKLEFAVDLSDSLKTAVNHG